MNPQPAGPAAVRNQFDLSGRVVVITGGAGFLGMKHAEAIASAGGHPVIVDLEAAAPRRKAEQLTVATGGEAVGVSADITSRPSVESLLEAVLQKFGRVDALVNNAANNPKVEKPAEVEFSRFENFPIAQWEADIAVGLTGMFLCSQVIGAELARRRR